MIKKDGLKKNFIFQILYQVVILIIPLIQAPILTRTLGDSGLGTYSYVNSIAYYFVLLAMLGIERHGQRIIANSHSDEELRKRFWSLLFDHVLVSLFSIFLYVILILFVGGGDIVIYWANLIYVASALFNITFLFYGLERFKTVLIKNLICKFVEFILIILLIKSPNDLIIYALISCTSILVGNILLFPTAIRFVKPIKFSFADCKLHIKPLLVLSISSIASSLYTVFNKTLIGLSMEKQYVAYYEYANKIINIPKAFIAVIGTVIFPRSCASFEKKDYESLKKYSGIAVTLISIISFSSIFGLLAIGDLFVVMYYGKEFSFSGDLLMAMTPLIFIVGLGDVVRNVFLIPMKKDTAYVVCVVINSLINIVISVSLISVIGAFGVILGTICAELFGLIFQYLLCRKEFSFKVIVRNTVPYLLIGVIMFVCVYFMKVNLPGTLSNLIIEILSGGAIFIGLVLAYIFSFEKSIKNMIVSMFRGFCKKK